MNTERTKFLPFILLGLANLVVVGGYIFLWVMTSNAHERVTTLNNELILEEARESRAQDTGRFLEDIRDDGELVRSFFVSRNNVVGAIETLEGLADITGAQVTITQVDAVGQTPETPGTLMVGMSGSGSWKQISQLLVLLETLPFHARITYVTLSTSPSSEGASTWTLQARLESQLVQ